MKKNKKVKAIAEWNFDCREDEPSPPIWILPRSRGDYDALLRQVEGALPLPWVIRRECAKLALRAIGITRPKG